MSAIEARLAELGVTLPDAPAPAANYVPFVVQGNTVYVSGQISNDANGFITGTLGQDMDTAAGAAIAIEAGCKVVDLAGDDLVYDPGQNIKHAGFIVSPEGVQLPVARE